MSDDPSDHHGPAGADDGLPHLPPVASDRLSGQKAAGRAARLANKAARQAAFKVSGKDNVVQQGRRVKLAGYIKGDRNRVEIKAAGETFNLQLEIRGNDNLVQIEENAAIRGLTVYIGNHVPAHQVRLEIGRNFSISRGGVFYLFNSGSRLRFGDDCLLSYNTVIRCGDSPHLIFERGSGQYLDLSASVEIGNRVWIGEGVYLGKRAGLADDTIVAARAVVTKPFDESFVAVGGNPARVIRRNVEWVRNPGLLVPGSPQHASYHAQVARFDRPCDPGAHLEDDASFDIAALPDMTQADT